MKLRLGNTRISLSFWFFALMACVVLLNRERLLAYFLLSVLVHECGHIAVLLFCRVAIREIRFSAFGIAIRRDPGAVLTGRGELCLCLGGIAANLVAAGILSFFRSGAPGAALLTAVNIAVALYSGLPISGLDGGQAVALLAARVFPPGTARMLSLISSLAVLSALFALAILQALWGRYNPTLLILCIYLIYNVALNS